MSKPISTRIGQASIEKILNRAVGTFRLPGEYQPHARLHVAIVANAVAECAAKDPLNARRARRAVFGDVRIPSIDALGLDVEFVRDIAGRYMRHHGAEEVLYVA